MRLPALPLLALIAAAAPGAAGAQEEKRSYPRNLITFEEIRDRAPDAKTAYDVVQRLRPQFLRTRPSGSIQNPTPVPVKVYVDGSSRAGVNALREILSIAVVDIIYLDGKDATTRYGIGHENGAIVVRTGAVRPSP